VEYSKHIVIIVNQTQQNKNNKRKQGIKTKQHKHEVVY